jgi:O-antigen ligase
VLPLSIAVCAISWRHGRRLIAVVAAVAAGIILASIFINISKAAMAICTGGLLAAGILFFRSATGLPRRWLIAGALAIAMVIATVATVGRGVGLNRWSQVSGTLNQKNGRWLMWRVAGGLAIDAAPWGTGPGTFKVLLPHAPQHLLGPLYSSWIVQIHHPGTAVSMWSYAHNDYLQALVEWGLPGTIAWGVLLFGGPVRAFMLIKRKSSAIPAAERLLLYGCLFSIAGVLLHALIDWPLQQVAIRHYLGILLALTWSAPSLLPQENAQQCVYC